MGWKIADDVAHFLYCPAMLGRRVARERWYHRIHLIPGFVLAWVCDRYERWLGTFADDGFFEEDEPVEKIKAAFDSGQKLITGRPVGWSCEHMNMTAGNAILSRPTVWCGCEMTPVFR